MQEKRLKNPGFLAKKSKKPVKIDVRKNVKKTRVFWKKKA